MTISTYAELKTALMDNWLVRTDQASRAPEFITLAEATINRRLRIREMESRALASTTIGGATIELPVSGENFLGLKRVQINTDPVALLNFLPLHQLSWENPSASTGKPTHYSISGTELYLRPVPDAVYSLEAIYLNRLAALSDSNVPTLFTNNPDLYLYGALSHAIPFINEPEETQRFMQFRGMFNEALAEIEKSDKLQRWGAAPLVTRADVGAP